MIPAYAPGARAGEARVITVLGHAAQPVMSLLGLPAPAAVPLVLGYVLNVYAAVGAMTPCT